MALRIEGSAPSLIIQKSAFERAGLTRAQFDSALNLTADEFRVEGGLIVVGPIVGETVLTELIEQLELAGLVFYDDFFDLSGNWPEWMTIFAQSVST
jgi:hypothetical protein